MGMIREIGRVIGQHVRATLGGTFGMILSSVGTVSSSMHVAGLSRPAEHLIWIYLGMKARADAVSQVPLRISTANDQLVDSGPLVDLMSSPNAWMDGVQYMALIESYLALYDEAWVVKVRNQGRGGVTELIPLCPAYCTPIKATHGPTGLKALVGIEYRDPQSSERHTFNMDELIPMLSYSPYDPTRALSPMRVGRRAMMTDLLAQEQNLAIFKNGGMPDVVFETDQPWTKEQADEFLERWQDRYGGTANAHKPGILYGGLKSKGIGLSPKELEFFEARRLSRLEQLALIQVSPAMVGLTEGETGLSQGTSIVEQVAAWWSNKGLHELARIAAAHQRYLVDGEAWAGSVTSRELSRLETCAREAQRLRMKQFGVRAPSKGRLMVWFDEHEIEALMEQRLGKIDILGKLLDRGWEPDAASDFLGLRLPPHPTNMPMLPFSIQPAVDVGGAVREDAAHGSATTARERSSKLDGLFAELDGALQVAARGAADAGKEREELSAKWLTLRKAMDDFLRPRERAVARKVSRFFVEQRARVKDRLAELVANAGTREGDPDVNETDLTPDSIADAVFPRGDEDDLLVARLAPLWTQHLRDGWGFLNEELGVEDADNPFAVDDVRVQAAIERRRIQGVQINATTETGLRDTLKLAFAEGDTTVQLAERIDDYYRDHIGEAKNRPMVAARTQTSGIVNDGRMLAARAAGGTLKKGWLHGAPEEARDNHLAAQRRYLDKPIGIDEPFIIHGKDGGSYSCDAPGATELPVGEVANCTCMVTFSAA